jgi:hypothetical protein
MEFVTASKISFGIIIGASLLIPMWITFAPHQRIKSGTVWIRTIVAIAATMAFLYSFYFFVLIPYGQWLMNTEPMLYSGVFLWHPNRSWASVSVISLVFLGILFTYRFVRHLREGPVQPIDRRAQQDGTGQPVKRSESIDFPDSIPYSASVAALSFTGTRPRRCAKK